MSSHNNHPLSTLLMSNRRNQEAVVAKEQIDQAVINILVQAGRIGSTAGFRAEGGVDLEAISVPELANEIEAMLENLVVLTAQIEHIGDH